MRLLMMRPQITPARTVARMAAGMPTAIMVPRLTPSELATSTEAAEGGTNA